MGDEQEVGEDTEAGNRYLRTWRSPSPRGWIAVPAKPLRTWRAWSVTDGRGHPPGRTGLVEELDGTEQHHQRQCDGEDVAAARPVEEDDHVIAEDRPERTVCNC